MSDLHLINLITDLSTAATCTTSLFCYIGIVVADDHSIKMDVSIFSFFLLQVEPHQQAYSHFRP